MGASGAVIAPRLRPIALELATTFYRIGDAAMVRVARGRENLSDLLAEAKARARNRIPARATPARSGMTCSTSRSSTRSRVGHGYDTSTCGAIRQRVAIVADALAATTGVHEVKIRPYTGSILVTHDLDVTTAALVETARRVLARAIA